MTQREYALKGEITPEMKQVAEDEGLPVEFILNGLKNGHIVILKNIGHNVKPVGVGEGLRVKVNANIGTSPEHMKIKEEIEKLRVAVESGTDTVMDLSLGAVLNEVRKRVLEESPVPVGTVPIYQVGFELSRNKKHIEEMTIDDFLNVMRQQGEEGVDFMTVHAGLTRRALELLKQKRRVLDVVSRGGSMLIVWMERNRKENPLYEHFDLILEVAKEYDITLSLGDGMRPGAIADATDRPQIEELITLGELAQKAWDAGVQVMIEGPGHVPLNKIYENITLEKSLCDGAPFYVLGPLPTDVAAGWDHIAGAVGGAIAAYAGADFLCYVTPAEHLRLPTPDDVREGVIAARIAGHIADIARGKKSAIDRDLKMSRARKKLDWEKMYEYAIDSKKAREYKESSEAAGKAVCTMCGDFCAVQAVNEVLGE